MSRLEIKNLEDVLAVDNKPEQILYEATVQVDGINAYYHVNQNKMKDMDDSRLPTLAHLENAEIWSGIIPENSKRVFGVYAEPGDLDPVFAVFAIQLDDNSWVPWNEMEELRIWDEENRIFGVHIVGDYKMVADFSRPNDIVKAVDRITKRIDRQCPFLALLSIRSPGKGLVWRPVDQDLDERTELWFKSKGEAYKNESFERFSMERNTKQEVLDILNVDKEILKWAIASYKSIYNIKNIDYSHKDKIVDLISVKLVTDNNVEISKMGFSLERVAILVRQKVDNYVEENKRLLRRRR